MKITKTTLVRFDCEGDSRGIGEFFNETACIGGCPIPTVMTEEFMGPTFAVAYAEADAPSAEAYLRAKFPSAEWA